MAARSIKIAGFTGMNNIKASERLFADRRHGIAEPRIVLNADVTEEGRIEKRDGYTKNIALANAHSMWAGSTCMLCMSGSKIYRIAGLTATLIQDIGYLQTPMFYAEVGRLVYMSNKYWNGIFDPDTDSISAWGVSPPEGPVLSAGGYGNLDAGTYQVCLTNERGSEISGNSPIHSTTITDNEGIAISNRPADATVWCTDPAGKKFYRVGKVDAITWISTAEPLPSLFCSQPPWVKNLVHAFGRMWGSVGRYLYYSEPFHVEWWRLSANKIEFATTITLVAKMRTGLFVGCEDRTYCLLGTEPQEMKQLDVGAGAIPGTLAYCNDIVELGDTISPPEKKHVSVPVWVSQEGIVAGNPAGRLFSLSQQKVTFSPGDQGASLYRKKNGKFQYLTSFQQGDMGSGLGMGDDATIQVVRNGKVI